MGQAETRLQRDCDAGLCCANLIAEAAARDGWGEAGHPGGAILSWYPPHRFAEIFAPAMLADLQAVLRRWRPEFIVPWPATTCQHHRKRGSQLQPAGERAGGASGGPGQPRRRRVSGHAHPPSRRSHINSHRTGPAPPTNAAEDHWLRSPGGGITVSLDWSSATSTPRLESWASVHRAGGGDGPRGQDSSECLTCG